MGFAVTHIAPMEIVFAYLAGLLTLINPCVLPVLPIVLATALQASKWGPLALAAGISLMFIALGIGISAFGPALGINDQVVAQVAAGVMLLFGLALMSPGLGAVFTRLTNGLAAKADAQLDEVDRGRLSGQFIGGLLLGIVWSPCIGPTLGGAIALASGGGSLLWAGAIMTGFALGVSTIICVLAYGARNLLQRRVQWMRALSHRARPILGAVFVLVGAMILFGVHHLIEVWAVQNLPFWLQDLSVRF